MATNGIHGAVKKPPPAATFSRRERRVSADAALTLSAHLITQTVSWPAGDLAGLSWDPPAHRPVSTVCLVLMHFKDRPMLHQTWRALRVEWDEKELRNQIISSFWNQICLKMIWNRGASPWMLSSTSLPQSHQRSKVNSKKTNKLHSHKQKQLF